MKNTAKKNWAKPEVKKLSIKNLTLGGSITAGQENTKGGNNKKIS